MTIRRGYGERGSTQKLFHPPVDFTCYAPAHAWSGPRWVDNIKALTGQRTLTVWLGQETLAGEKLLVGTLPLDRFTHAVSTRLPTQQHATAAEAAHIAANAMRDAASPRTLLDAATHPDSWPHHTWTVDEAAVEARISCHGPVWMGFIELDTAFIAAVATNIPPEIALGALTDTTSYGPDLAQPISVNAVGHTSRHTNFD